MKDSDSSPFKIRLEVLTMARNMVMEELYMNRERSQHIWEANDRKGELVYPEFPGSQKVIEKAQELYTFITTKS
jgi:hypothetical protein